MDIAKATVKPKAGMKVSLQNGTGHVPEAGVEVELTTYYRRRIKDGDLEIAKPTKHKE